MSEVMQSLCACGHERALHDPNGCAAFLGAFAATAHIKRYCSCKRPGSALLSVIHDSGLRPPVVAEVRLRERRGAAIGVCEFPPALELGASAERVIAAMKARLLDVISPPANGAPQVVRIVHEGERESSVRLELLR